MGVGHRLHALHFDGIGLHGRNVRWSGLTGYCRPSASGTRHRAYRPACPHCGAFHEPSRPPGHPLGRTGPGARHGGARRRAPPAEGPAGRGARHRHRSRRPAHRQLCGPAARCATCAAAAQGERAALRGAGGLLRRSAGQAPEVQQLLVGRGRAVAGRSRGPCAGHHLHRAELADGQQVLELGCGWGSLSLWMAQRYPASRITAVSNSQSQRAHIEAEAARRGLHNLQVITCDMNRFDTTERFDRVVSVEMFEHMRNWPELFGAVSRWLRPAGRFFLHVFTHQGAPYEFVERDATDWMSRHFFSGGMMPSDDLALHFQDELRLRHRWRWDGRHYERTATAWLANMDAARDQVWPVLEQTYGATDAAAWWMRWRLFFISCAELFGFEQGQRWGVSHYLFEPRHPAAIDAHAVGARP
ncbi:class I SAM-dependent methyltransferase [Ideonella sp. BN130291]|uniref:class I SAM-dependent methyltransferase n=1 Tax=Ideonella sp. BN130291 TaxID=3112940 RepID=UPI002E266DBA|nr:class I SAM-dependent methyltransferase [Ideonella sp. BN130291]